MTDQEKEIIGEEIKLELGSIITILAPTDPQLNEQSFYIRYLDNDIIELSNIQTFEPLQLRLDDNGLITNESIQQILILSKSEEKGFARQHNLLPKTWVDIHFGGEVPVVITGEITNLEDDMIEITTFPDMEILYIDFAYKGMPKHIPLEQILIRNKPASLEKISSLVNIRERVEDEGMEAIQEELQPKSSMQYTPSGDIEIVIEEGATADDSVHNRLQSEYANAKQFVYEDVAEEYAQEVELPEHQQRFSLETQVNDLLDELLLKIPQDKRTQKVTSQIHLLIERFKELRTLHSRFDDNGNVITYSFLGKDYKPLVESLHELKNKLKWILPVVSIRKKIYTDMDNENYNDVLQLKETEVLLEEEEIQQEYQANQLRVGTLTPYANMNQSLNPYSIPFEGPLDAQYLLTTNESVDSEIESIVNNLEDFYSTVALAVKGNVQYARRQYVVQKYDLGTTYLEPKLSKQGKKIYVRKNLTPNESISIRSLLTLPLPVWHFSKVKLPLSSILTKTQFSQQFFQLYRYFNRRLDITNHELYNFKENKEDDFWKKPAESGTLKHLVQHFSIDEKEEFEQHRFEDFLQAVFPSGEGMVRMLDYLYSEKESYSHLSIYRGAKALEPFMFYANTMNYSQYNSMRFFVKTFIQKYRKHKEEHNNQLNLYKTYQFRGSEPLIASIFRLFSEKHDLLEVFLDSYQLKTKSNSKHYEGLSSASTISSVLIQDDGILFYDLIKFMMYSLIIPKKMMDVLDNKEMGEDELETIRPNDCTTRVLTKKYTSLDALFKDNNKNDVFYDKEYDNTPYKILDKYKEERKKYSDDEMVEFLEEILIQKHDVPPKFGKQIALDILSGKKLVVEGEYAVVEIKPEPKSLTLDEENDPQENRKMASEANVRKKIAYYKRKSDHWVVDKEVDEHAFLDSNDLFCNMSKICFRDQKNNKCETLQDAEKRLKNIARQKLLDEFDERFAVSSEGIQEDLKTKVTKSMKFLKAMHQFLYIQRNKYSIRDFDLGKMAKEDTTIRSPYLSVRDKILGQGDFVKVQNDILRFVELFCRDPMVEQLGETPYYLYCKESNSPLLPTFFWELAQAFVSTNTYSEKLGEIVRTQGTLSEDGDCIVDKYSGYVLRKIDNVAEDAYDEAGFKIQTSDILEEDAGQKFVELMVGKQSTKEIVFEDEETEMIFKLYKGIAKNIGIPLDSIQEQVIRMSKEIILKVISSKDVYEMQTKQKEEENKKRLPSYEMYKNKSIILIVTSVMLYSIQTAIPSFQIHKTFPGCVRSFDGFPDQEGSMTNTMGLDYLACILNKMKTKTTKPWNSIKSIPMEILKNQMVQIIQMGILTNNNYMEAYVKKAEYLVLHPDETIPNELSIQQWKQFLPPVIRYSVTKDLKNIPSEYAKELVEMQVKGDKNQRKHMNIFLSKARQYGLGIIEEINKVVKSKGLLLKTASQVYYTENACCNERNASSVLRYFEEENDHISDYKKLVYNWQKQVYVFQKRAEGSFLFDPKKTGLTYGTELPSNHEEINIYSAFIYYCHLDDLRPIPEELKGLFPEKIPDYPKSAPLIEKIDFLKRHGKKFGPSHLQQLMTIINRQNLIKTYFHKDGVNKVEGLKDLLSYFENRYGTDEDVLFSYSFREKLGDVLEKYNPKIMVYEDNDETYRLNNWLTYANTDLLARITDFIQRNGNLSRRKVANYETFLANVHIWDKEKDNKNAMFEVALFMRNSLHSFSKVFPEMIVNKTSPHFIPQKYMDLAKQHYADIAFFIHDYYQPLAKFQEDKGLNKVLSMVKEELSDLVLFMDMIPLQAPLVKDINGEEATFYSLFDKRTVYMLYTYVYYSTFYEFIKTTDNDDLIQMEQLERRQIRRDIIRENNDEFIVGPSQEEYENVEEAELGDGQIEIDIQLTNPDELKSNLCKLLLTFLDIDMKNKKILDVTYVSNDAKVEKSKLKEKKLITDFLRDLNPDERRVEDTNKMMKLGRWNVGLQQGLVHYDAGRYKEERKQLFEQLNGMGDIDDYNDVPLKRNADQMDQEEEQAANEFYEDEANDFRNFRGDDADGAFYEEDMDNEFED